MFAKKKYVYVSVKIQLNSDQSNEIWFAHSNRYLCIRHFKMTFFRFKYWLTMSKFKFWRIYLVRKVKKNQTGIRNLVNH